MQPKSRGALPASEKATLIACNRTVSDHRNVFRCGTVRGTRIKTAEIKFSRRFIPEARVDSNRESDPAYLPIRQHTGPLNNAHQCGIGGYTTDDQSGVKTGTLMDNPGINSRGTYILVESAC